MQQARTGQYDMYQTGKKGKADAFLCNYHFNVMERDELSMNIDQEVQCK